MKILLVSSFLPYPLHSGGHVRLFNLIKELAGKHEITLICEKRENQSEDDILGVKKICKKVITVNRGKQWTIKNVFKSVFSSNSFLVTGHKSQKMNQEISIELKNKKYDLIHVETYYVMQNLPNSSIPVVLAEHNIEYQVYQRYADQSPFFLKPLFNIDILKIRKEEESCWARATKLIAVSEDDKKVMKNTGVDPTIVSNGVDLEKFTFLQRTKNQEPRIKRVLFIGDFRWIQNRDAAKFIIDEIFPKIKTVILSKAKILDPSATLQDDEIKLWVVGRNIPDNIRSLTNEPDVIFDEESSTRPTEELFQEADVLLAPIRVGGGTSYKILESMCCGTPVVATSLSANAVGAKDGENIMVAEDAKELAKKTVEVLEDNNLYENIAKNGRKLIEENYTWKRIAKDLERVYSELRIKN
ncbi:MAG TPA: glycosyltransferase family 4 protein [Candidatus Limnocylindrales bacterium]|nr:glycosyltransferase family 4 protein [Candidatus Limnocylindrales bacterium]